MVRLSHMAVGVSGWGGAEDKITGEEESKELRGLAVESSTGISKSLRINTGVGWRE